MKKMFACAVVMIGLLACASTEDQMIEEIQFKLDRAEFSAARAQAAEGMVLFPNIVEFQVLFGRAAVAEAVLGDGNTYISLVASFLEPNDAAESDTETFLRLTPSETANALTLLFNGRDALVDVPAADRDPDVCISTYMARLFEMSAILAILDNNVAGTDCLDVASFTGEHSSRFREDVANAPDDRTCAELDVAGDNITVRLEQQLQGIEDQEALFPGDARQALIEFVRIELDNRPDC